MGFINQSVQSIKLTEVIGKTDFLTKWLGVSVESKLNGTHHYRRTALVVLMHCGLIHSLLVACVPTSDEETLLKYADIGFHMLGPYRYFLFWIDFFFRLNPALMVTYFYFDDLSWMRQANQVIARLDGLQISTSMRKHIQRSRAMIIVLWIAIGSCPMICTVASIFRFWERNSRYKNLTFAYLYISLFGFLDVLISCKFIIQLYLVCKIAVDLFRQVNEINGYQLALYRSGIAFASYHRSFWQLCIFVHHLRAYLRTYYLIYLICFFPVCAPFLYVSIFYSEVEPAIRLVFFLLMCYLAWLLVFLSNLIGQIDKSSRSLSDLIYESFVIKARCYSSQYIVERLIKYFQHVWGSTASVDILGQKVNSELPFGFSPRF